MKSKLFIAALAIGMLAGTTLSADARSHKHHKHHSSMATEKSMKSDGAASKGDATGQGTVGPGTTNNNSPSGTKK
jgi:hypothetical protein